MKSGVRECGGNLPGQGLGLAPCLLAILLESQARCPPPQGVRSEVLVMTGMAAQGERPGEHVSHHPSCLPTPGCMWHICCGPSGHRALAGLQRGTQAAA